MANQITIVDTGLVYENPKMVGDRIHVQQPSLIMLTDVEFIATFILDHVEQEFGGRVVVSRSVDAGQTWDLEGDVVHDPPASTTHSMPATILSDGTLIGIVQMNYFDEIHQSSVNVETYGRVPGKLYIVRSSDGGHSWTDPSPLKPPLIGPGWEVCHHVLELANGRLLIPTATWRGWNGENPSGEQTVAFISDDGGTTWPRYSLIFDGRDTLLTHWEKSVIQLTDGRVLAVAWVYDTNSSQTLPSVYAVSTDNGESFSHPIETGFLAQTCKLIQIQDGRILAIYRRHDQPGLWATVVDFNGNYWTNLNSSQIWSGADSGMSGVQGGAKELLELKFGYPNFSQLPDGNIFLLFWCEEDGATNIRWIRLRITN